MLKLLSGVMGWLMSKVSRRGHGAWRTPSAEAPERGVPIEWTNSGGDIVRGRFLGVWMMDNGMYVYYTPTRWRYVADEA